MSKDDKIIIQECDHNTGRQLYEIDGVEVWLCDWSCGRVTIEPQGVEVTDMYKELVTLRAELEAVKGQRAALLEPHVIISVFGKDKEERLVNLCQNIDPETVNGVMSNLDVFVDEWVNFDDMPPNAICKLYKLKDIHYESPQIGNYPPPNVEVPGYWDFNWEFIGYEYQEQNA